MRRFDFYSDTDDGTHLAIVYARDETEARSTLRAHLHGFPQNERPPYAPPGPYADWIDPRLEERHAERALWWHVVPEGD